MSATMKRLSAEQVEDPPLVEFRPPYFHNYESNLGKGPSLLVMRHAERHELVRSGDLSSILAVQLTAQGKKNSESFGRYLRETHPQLEYSGFTISSPSGRCLDTVGLVLKGGKYVREKKLEDIKEDIKTEDYLALRGVYSQETVRTLFDNHHQVMKIFTGELPVPEINFELIAQNLVKILMENFVAAIEKEERASDESLFGLAAVHDMTLAYIINHYVGFGEATGEWPHFSETLMIQIVDKDKKQYRIFWRKKVVDINLD